MAKNNKPETDEVMVQLLKAIIRFETNMVYGSASTLNVSRYIMLPRPIFYTRLPDLVKQQLQEDAEYKRKKIENKNKSEDQQVQNIKPAFAENSGGYIRNFWEEPADLAFTHELLNKFVRSISFFKQFYNWQEFVEYYREQRVYKGPRNYKASKNRIIVVKNEIEIEIQKTILSEFDLIILTGRLNRTEHEKVYISPRSFGIRPLLANELNIFEDYLASKDISSVIIEKNELIKLNSNIFYALYNIYDRVVGVFALLPLKINIELQVINDEFSINDLRKIHIADSYFSSLLLCDLIVDNSSFIKEISNTVSQIIASNENPLFNVVNVYTFEPRYRYHLQDNGFKYTFKYFSPYEINPYNLFNIRNPREDFLYRPFKLDKQEN